MILQRKIVWVTGGGTGIGKALAAALYQQGHWVVISGRRQEVLTQAAHEITSKGTRQAGRPGDIWAIAGDASDAAHVTEVQRSVREKWGDVDWLINNAGVNPYHSFQEASPEEFEQNFRTNVMSAVRCTKAVLPAMLARRSGSIVNVSSILGRFASPDSSAYSTSKYALAGFTDSLRQELAETGVHVMGVYPGVIFTAMTQPFLAPGSRRRRFAKSPESMAAAILKGIERRRRDVIYPWYVPWVLQLHTLFPGAMEKFRTIFRRGV